MRIHLPFMYYVKNADGTSKFVVKIAKCHDYVRANVAWMDDPQLPPWDMQTDTGTLMPDVDICEEAHEFTSELDAIKFISAHYVSELSKISG